MATNSATSTTKSEASGTLATFATFRVSGDRLDPDAVSGVLNASASVAYRKGERYFAGARGGYVLGRTGVWYLSTKYLVAGLDPIKHLLHLTRLLDGPQTLTALRHLMQEKGLKASASLFWHGRAGAREPTIPPDIESAFDAVPAPLERDFDID